ncbi:bifunctional phosphoribosylaminoimidazole carboxylase/phosphoribosylaminoimidazole succinocarboxamide synthetase isoform X2 [Pseudophryne corroboree]|uniref:bifunctional phosphoribosylaminoimidazole carboxylase/phosphoribosylaminoimidazole succinocarboxamide synthetase isoform X2 n=1 Tax=Pseudophryne corroboree TaxID=495146 RepID=UPI003081A336
MERGAAAAGRYWTEDEIRALISVWSERSIRKQLQGTLRNKGLFMYIARRMQQLGVYRDWKQCRAKYKNLKYEYRAMHCGHSTGDMNKLRFYGELHAILGSSEAAAGDEASNAEPGASYVDPSGDVTAMEEAMLGHQKHGGTTNPLLIPPVCNEGGKHWTTRETRALINIWSDKNIRGQLKGTVRNQRIFEHIARLLQQSGIDRDWRQCRTKYKNLKHEYVVVKKAHESGNKSKTMKYFNELETILSSKPAGHRKTHTDKPSHLSCTRAAPSEVPADCPAGDRSMRLHSAAEKPQLVRRWVALPAPKRMTTVTEGGRHWTNAEIKALLTVWADGNIRKSLAGTVRNRKIFEHIASLLQKLGVDRDWRQCRTKYKNLKHEYIVTKKALESGCTNRTMKFFNMLDEILRNKDSELPTLPEAVDLGSSVPRTHLRNVSHVTECCTTVLAKSPVSNEEARTLSEGNLSKVPDENISSPKTPNIKQEPIFSDHPSDSEGAEQPLSSRENVTMTVVKEETSQVGTELEDEADKDFRIVTVNDTGGGRNWSDHEVRSLLHVWSEERISRQLEGTFRNKELFEEIAHKLLECGINRDWKQCRTKYKNLKYEYYSVKKDETLHALRKSMKFYEEIDHLIQRLPKASEVTADSVHIEGFTCRGICEEPNTITTQQGLIAEERTVEMNKLVIGLKRKSSPNEPNTPDKKKPTRIPIPEASIINMSESYATGRLSSPHSGSQSASKEQAPGEARFHDQGDSCVSIMESSAELRVGKKLNEGKTKEVYELPEHPGCVLMQSKDQITAGNAARKDHMEGKASISNKTTSCIFKMLQEAGIKTAFVKKCSETGFIATHCEMIPIEWVCRRIATGSFLKRNPGVKEGYRFYPPKVETFFKDDANNDPQWSEEQLIATKLTCAGLLIGQAEVDIMSHSTVAIFEILEKAWSTQDCTLVDMKIEFGVDVTKKEIVLADVIDNDSWRLWPSGDKTQQKDKQTYRDLKEITPEAMQMVKRNFEWVADRVELLLTSESQGRVVVLMGSISDLVHCEKIKKSSSNYGIPCELRVTSAHKGPDETLRIKSEYEGDGIPTVFVAVAGRSNGLGPVLSGNTAYPVINCPPLTADWGAQDVWSSLRMPSGLGCSTVLSPEAAAQFAAQIFGLNNHLVWSKLRSCTLNTWISLKQADVKLRECSM